MLDARKDKTRIKIICFALLIALCITMVPVVSFGGDGDQDITARVDFGSLSIFKDDKLHWKDGVTYGSDSLELGDNVRMEGTWKIPGDVIKTISPGAFFYIDVPSYFDFRELAEGGKILNVEYEIDKTKYTKVCGEYDLVKHNGKTAIKVTINDFTYTIDGKTYRFGSMGGTFKAYAVTTEVTEESNKYIEYGEEGKLTAPAIGEGTDWGDNGSKNDILKKTGNKNGVNGVYSWNINVNMQDYIKTLSKSAVDVKKGLLITDNLDGGMSFVTSSSLKVTVPYFIIGGNGVVSDSKFANWEISNNFTYVDSAGFTSYGAFITELQKHDAAYGYFGNSQFAMYIKELPGSVNAGMNWYTFSQMLDNYKSITPKLGSTAYNKTLDIYKEYFYKNQSEAKAIGFTFDLQTKITGLERDVTNSISMKWIDGVEQIVKDTIHFEGYEVTAYATILGQIVINKVDADSLSPLEGVEFDVYQKIDESKTEDDDSNWKVVKNGKTDRDGLLSFHGLDPGTYKIIEVGGLVGYDGTLKITFQDGTSLTGKDKNEFVMPEVNEGLTFIAKNTKKTGNAQIVKLDKKDNNPIEGAVFYLKKSDGNPLYKGKEIYEVTTNEDGVATWSGLKWDTYTVVEKSPAPGYKGILEFTEGTGTFPIDAKNVDALVKMTAVNERDTGEVELTKKNASDETILIQGAEFLLEKEVTEGGTTTFKAMDNPSGSGLWIKETDGNGVVTFGGLDWGKYRIVEYDAATGYEPNSAVFTGGSGTALNEFTIGPDSTTAKMKFALKATNEPKKGEAMLTKRATGSAAELISGASFYLIKDGVKYPSAANTKYYTSDKDGQVVFDNLPWGSYEIKETEVNTAQGYTGKIQWPVGKDGKFVIDAEHTGVVKEVTGYNDRAKGEFTLTKKSTGSGVSAPVVGAGFKLQISSGGIWKDTGKTTVSNVNGQVKFGDLEWGTYKVVETTPAAGYVNGLIISDNGVFTIDKDTPKMEKHMIGYNERTPGKVTLLKTDAEVPSDLINGAEFYLKTVKDSKTITITATAVDGVVSWDNLDWGTYTIHESKPATGYDGTFALEGNTIIIGNSEGAKLEWDLEATNTKNKGTVELTKLDSVENAKKIEGASFYLKKDGEVYKTTQKGIYTTLVAFTQANGVVTFSDLPWGEYEVFEHAPADGYQGVLEFTENSYSGNNDGKFELNAENVHQKITLEAKNDRLTGTAMLIKRDAEDPGKLLEGATFYLKDSKGNVVNDLDGTTKEAITNSSGEAFFYDLEWDTYTVYESETPSGYSMNSFEAFTFTVNEKNVNKIIKLKDVTNSKNSGRVELTKLDETSSKTAISGASFYLIKDGEVYKTTQEGIGYTTEVAFSNKDGLVVFTGLPWGKYKIMELEAAPGYEDTLKFVSNSSTGKKDGEFELTPANVEEVVKITAENERILGDVELLKQDPKYNTKLEGAEFYLLDASGKAYRDSAGNIVKATSDSNGIAKFENLPWGDYTVTESAAALGYEISTFEMANGGEFSVGAGNVNKVIKLTADNTRTLGKAQIVKTEEKYGGNIAGAEFYLLDSNGNVVMDANGTTTKTAITGPNGVGNFDKLDWGIYTVVESKPGNGYKASPIRYKGGVNTFEITAGSLGLDNIIKIEATNERHDGKIKITKSDSNGGAKLEGAVFYLEFNGNVLKDENGLTVTAITNKNGVATFGSLEWGDYEVKEQSPATGYKPELTISDDGKVTIGAGNAEAYVTFDATNERKDGSGKVVKTALEYGENISGASFYLIDSSGNVVLNKNGTTKEAISNADGEALFTDLPWDTYTVKEGASATGYKAGTIKFANDKDTFIVTSTSVDTILQVDATNERYDGKIEITKSDSEDGTVLKGAKFSLEYNGSILQNSKGENIVVKTDENGIAKFDNLKWGTYKVIEVEPAPGYAPGSLKIENDGIVHINKLNVEKKITFDATNDRIPGKVEIEKLDSTDKSKLSGAEFYLKKDGDVYKTTIGGVFTTATAVTNTSGVATFTDLPWGDYEVIELTPAKGYVEGSLKFTEGEGKFTVNAGSEKEFKLTATNDRIIGSFILEKLDAKDLNKKLAGAEFYLEKYNEETKTYEPLKYKDSLLLGITDVNGIAIFSDLEWGKYKVIERKAPAGYELNSLVFESGTDEFIVGASQQHITFTAYNDVDSSVLGEEANPAAVQGEDASGVSGVEGSVLGEEAKTGDYYLDLALIFGSMLAALLLLALAIIQLNRRNRV